MGAVGAVPLNSRHLKQRRKKVGLVIRPCACYKPVAAAPFDLKARNEHVSYSKKEARKGNQGGPGAVLAVLVVELLACEWTLYVR